MSLLKLISIKSLALASCAATVTLPTTVHAQAEQKVSFDIKAQDLGRALTEFGMQSGKEIYFTEVEVRGKKTNGVKGSYTPNEAIRRLLASTNITYRIDSNGTILVGKTYSARSQSTPSLNATPPEREEELIIVVTGTNIRGTGPIGSKVISVDREEIEKSGFTSVQEVIQSIPQNSQAGAVSNFGAAAVQRGVNVTLGTGINLRGLGARSSLTLINGRRRAPGSLGTFVDVSTIPLSAIERVEVLADGASAIYGSDAVAGVVNFILRSDYEGAETSVGYRNTTEGGGREWQVSQLVGTNWDSGNFIAGYEFTDRNAILNRQRRATSNCDLTDRGGDNFCSNQSNPGNITNIGGMPVTLAIPSGQDGTSLDESDLIAGQFNTFFDLENGSLSPGEERHSAFGQLTQNLGGGTNIFIEAFYGRRDSLFAAVRSGQALTVPESNAYRQQNSLFPGQGNMTLLYNLTPDLGPTIVDTFSESWSLSAGLEAELVSSWYLELFGTLSRQDEGAIIANGTDTAVLTEALLSDDLATSFNPFADGSNTSQSVLNRISGRQLNQGLQSEIRNFGARINGDLLNLPGGTVKLAVGTEYREEEALYEQFSVNAEGVRTQDLPNPLQPPFDRNIISGYAEIVAPIFGPGNNIPGFNELDLTAAVRVEDYSDFGTTTNPKFGVSWSPFNSVRVIGTYGTSFSVSNLNDNLSPLRANAVALPGFLDPRSTDGSTLTLVLAGGNPDLGPEEGEAFTIGVEFEPTFIPGLSLELNYFDVSVNNAIGSVSNVLVFFANEEALTNAGLMIRNPTAQEVQGVISQALVNNVTVDPDQIELILFAATANAGVLSARGLDFQIGYDLDSDIGRFGFDLSGSYLFELSESLAAGLETIRNEGRVRFPSDFSGRASLSWSDGPLSVATSLNYVGAYQDNLSTPERDIDDWATVDAQISYRFGEEGTRGLGLDGTVVSLSVTNLFNAEPPFVNNFSGIAYDSANANPLGRQIGLRVTKRW